MIKHVRVSSPYRGGENIYTVVLYPKHPVYSLGYHGFFPEGCRGINHDGSCPTVEAARQPVVELARLAVTAKGGMAMDSEGRMAAVEQCSH